MAFKSIFITMATISLFASACLAGGSPRPGAEGSIEASVFHDPAGDIDLDAPNVDKTLRMGGKRIGSPVVPASRILAGRSPSHASRKKRMIISVLCSAVLPGLGELYLYRETGDKGILARAPLFFAAEGYLWYGYIHNHSKGKDIKEEYMDFADEHWSLERFLALHPCCAGLDTCESWQVYNEALKRGAYLRPLGNVVYITPPLNIDEPTLEELLQIVTDSVRAVTDRSA